MKPTMAVILAAGRGSRMRELTSARPKCLTPLAGRPLLHWQLDALRRAGALRTLVVRGYLKRLLVPEANGLPPEAFATTDNPRWAETNMLSTLLEAGPWLEEGFASGFAHAVVAYSDIVYRHEHVVALVRNPLPIAITYDVAWESLWRLRFADPLLDAETFLEQDGRLVDIGGAPTALSDVHGQYMGLLKFDRQGWKSVRDACAAMGEAVDKTDMTSFLRRLLSAGADIGAVAVCGGWCEVDSEDDLRAYEQELARTDGSTIAWDHDFRH